MVTQNGDTSVAHTSWYISTKLANYKIGNKYNVSIAAFT